MHATKTMTTKKSAIKPKIKKSGPKQPSADAPVDKKPANARRARSVAPKSARTSALAAAVRVLAESGQLMTTGELIEAMAAKGYWKSPGGKTPAATLYSATTPVSG